MGPIDFGKSMKVIHIFKLLRKYGILTTEKKIFTKDQIKNTKQKRTKTNQLHISMKIQFYKKQNQKFYNPRFISLNVLRYSQVQGIW